MTSYNTLLDLATDIGYELAICGAETFRVEESVSRILAAYGLDAEVFSIPNCLIVTLHTCDGQTITRMRRIGHHGNDLDAVEKFNALCRAICNRTPDPSEGLQWFQMVHRQRLYYPRLIQYLGYFLGAVGFCLFFNGSFTDSLCSGLCGMLVGCVNMTLDARKANQFFRTIASSFLMAMLAYGLGSAGLASDTDAVNIGALMLLVPGLLFTNAMRDIIYGDTTAGINRVVQVFLVAMAIALGTGGAWQLSVRLWGVPAPVESVAYPIFLQCLFVYISCIGFAILFNIHGPGVLLCALGGALSWAVYRFSLELGSSDIVAYFFSVLFSSVYSETMARIRKYPAISYLVLSIFPLIPGAGVYFAMSYAVQGQTDLFAEQTMHTAAIAGILAVGILLGSTVFRMYSEWKLHRH